MAQTVKPAHAAATEPAAKSRNPAKSFFIVFGFAEGPKIGTELTNAMLKAGYVKAAKSQDADIIIAHSGGCFFIPEGLTADLYVLIGMPYWPGKPIGISSIQKVTQDMTDHAKKRQAILWLRKTAWNLFYMGGDGVWTARLLAKRHKVPIPRYSEGVRVIAVRNLEDPYFSPAVKDAISDRTDWEFVELPGGHDDCWSNPEPYVSIVRDTLA